MMSPRDSCREILGRDFNRSIAPVGAASFAAPEPYNSTTISMWLSASLSALRYTDNPFSVDRRDELASFVATRIIAPLFLVGYSISGPLFHPQITGSHLDANVSHLA